LVVLDDYKSSAKSQGCPVDHVRKGVSIGIYYYALCCQYGYGTLKDFAFATDLIKKAIELCPYIAFDVHEKAILGTA
ncbi:uncharacterized protein NPIL_451411, partial [Nephila pilipes]